MRCWRCQHLYPDRFSYFLPNKKRPPEYPGRQLLFTMKDRFSFLQKSSCPLLVVSAVVSPTS